MTRKFGGLWGEPLILRIIFGLRWIWSAAMRIAALGLRGAQGAGMFSARMIERFVLIGLVR